MKTKPSTTDMTETAKPKAAHGSKSARITLTSGDAVLVLNARAKKDGTAETFVTTTAGKNAKRVRGMSAKHKTLADAQAVLEGLAKKAESTGWKRKAVGPGFKAKPDAFSALPLPPKPTGKKS